MVSKVIFAGGRSICGQLGFVQPPVQGGGCYDQTLPVNSIFSSHPHPQFKATMVLADFGRWTLVRVVPEYSFAENLTLRYLGNLSGKQ